MDNQLKASNQMVSANGPVAIGLAGSAKPGQSPTDKMVSAKATVPFSSADAAKLGQSATILSLKDALKLYYPMLVLAAAIEVLLWVHWNSLVETASFWDEYKYSHGYLVPLFAAVLLFLWRDERSPLVSSLAYLGAGLVVAGLMLCAAPAVVPEHLLVAIGGKISGGIWQPAGVALTVVGAVLIIQQAIPFDRVSPRERWIGLAIVLAAEALRYWATLRSLGAPERITFIVALTGAFIMVGGLGVLRWAGWALLFLPFMLPMPAVMDTISANLQAMATTASTFLLQTLGIAAIRDGNLVYVGSSGTAMNVAEACSGLQMLTIFGAMSFAVALLSPHRPMWQRVTIVVSAVPIALAVNVARITTTGLLFTFFTGDQESLRKMVHDWAGLLIMMPMALGLMFLEFQFFDHLFIDDEDLLAPVPPVPLPVRRSRPEGAPPLAGPPLAAPATLPPPPRPASVTRPAPAARPTAAARAVPPVHPEIPPARPAVPPRPSPPIARGAKKP